MALLLTLLEHFVHWECQPSELPIFLHSHKLPDLGVVLSQEHVRVSRSPDAVADMSNVGNA